MAKIRLAALLLLLLAASSCWAIDSAARIQLKSQVHEMFDHAYSAYMDHAYPADELMPLSCQGRVRGRTPSRGDVDDALGHFSLTLVDTLDTLALMGNHSEFYRACTLVIENVQFDTDIVVSTFETNIRVLGGLLGAHAMVLEFVEQALLGKLPTAPFLENYSNELLHLAQDLGDRLMRAFDTKTGLPYSRINLRHGVDNVVRKNDVTCTACAGTLILEFGALSRYTGDPTYEAAARRALEALWTRRAAPSDLVGMTINITSGSWLRKETSVGAGIDSYYEYLLKGYVLLGEETYLRVFNRHYDAVMRHLYRNPYLLTTDMNNPGRSARKVMDALQTFWPGLQVLKGDLEPAIDTHRMYYHLSERYGFIPEGFTTDFKINWGNYPLRPEFAESTYFLWRATKDPFYLEVGQSIIRSYQSLARVPCGFAAIHDLRTGKHQDQMDSFVLAETFKYLFLLFSEPEELPFDLDKFVFTTEAHLVPLALRNVKLPLEPFAKFPKAQSPQLHDSICEIHSEDSDLNRFKLLVHMRAPLANRCLHYDISISVPRKQQRPQQTASTGSKTAQPSKRPVPSLLPEELDIGSAEHIAMLAEMNIFIETVDDGTRLYHEPDPSNPNAVAGMHFMMKLAKLMEPAKNDRAAVLLHVAAPGKAFDVIGAPALFGPPLNTGETVLSAEAVIAAPHQGCAPLTNPDALNGKFAIIQRGDCSFAQKVTHAEEAGAIAAIIFDLAEHPTPSTFAMSGDDVHDDVDIPAMVIFGNDARAVIRALQSNPQTHFTMSGAQKASP
eukprot:m.88552 g.88552  ORF g.88552 m.88552 type:complete len:784 (-) comp8508_c0_seq1:159-2510(-)